MGQIAAFFDFDGTIIVGDSYRKFLKYNLKNLPFSASVKMIFIVLLRKLKIISLKEAKEKSLNCIARNKDLEALSLKFYNEIIKPLLLKEAISKIKWHQKQNHLVIIASSAPDIYFTHLKDSLGLDYVIASPLEINNGKFSLKQHYIGESKSEKIMELSNRLSLDLAKSYAYSDNHSDIPMLEAVKNPYIVAPTNRLRQYARNKGWTELKW